MKNKIYLEQQLAICFAALCFLLVGIFAGTHFAPALLTAQVQVDISVMQGQRLQASFDSLKKLSSQALTAGRAKAANHVGLSH